jgi:molecular chaperone GrpE (heat shock protein)
MLAGMVGVAGTLLTKMHEQRQAARYKLQLDSRADDYFDLYDDQGRIRTQEQLRWEQQARLKADVADLAKGTKIAPIFADVLYGDNWREEVSRYKNKMKLTNCILGGSAISILAGLIIGLTYRGRHVVPAAFGRLGQLGQERAKTSAKNAGDVRAEVVSSEGPDTASGWQGQQQMSGKTEPDGERSYFGWRREQSLADSLGLRDSLARKAQAFGKADGQLGQSVLMSTEPVTNTLDELTQEVSAIREFTAQQQDRVRQLQEGYDWTIIKRFCLRIIRCIDNLNERIRKLSQQNQETGHLEDVRDELVFALESSGVEQFEPEIDADYKGLEKLAEAVQERESTQKTRLSGKISKVVRPGYQYVLNSDDVKIVRTAQVRLYG